MTKVLLYSGGLDSLCTRYVWKPDVLLYVDLGSAYSVAEIARLDGDVQVVRLRDVGQWEREDRIIPLRNLFLVAVAAQYGDTIALGATAGDRVLDKSYEFARMTTELFTYLWRPQHWTDGKAVQVVLPVKNLTKRALVRAAIDSGVSPLHLETASFSCYEPQSGAPCGRCKPCWRRWVAFAGNGIWSKPNCRDYVREVVYPALSSGTEDRGAELADVEHALSLAGVWR